MKAEHSIQPNTDRAMLTPFVTTLVFTNVMATAYALPWAALIGAANSMSEKKSSPRR